jgi:hypothetical protein
MGSEKRNRQITGMDNHRCATSRGVMMKIEKALAVVVRVDLDTGWVDIGIMEDVVE